MALVNILIGLPEGTIKALERRAKEAKTNRSAYIRDVLEVHLKKTANATFTKMALLETASKKKVAKKAASKTVVSKKPENPAKNDKLPPGMSEEDNAAAYGL